MVSVERLREVLRHEDGVLYWKVDRSHNAKAGDVAGDYNTAGYRRVKVDGKRCMAHRVVWALEHGYWPTQPLDHKNGTKDDNRISNLREVTALENTENIQKPSKTCVSGYRGVSKFRGRYRATLWSKGKQHFLGYYDTPEEAHEVYMKSKAELHAGWWRESDEKR